MSRSVTSALKVVGVALIVIAPLAIHAAIATSTWTQLIVVVPVLQLLILSAIAVFRDPARIRWLGPLTVVAAFAIVWAERSGLTLTAMPGLPHAMAYSALLVGFGYTLLPGHEAILTRAVNAVRGPLPPEMIVHTRRVTFAWCCFFAAQLLGSLLLYLFAPLEAWSLFIKCLEPTACGADVFRRRRPLSLLPISRLSERQALHDIIRVVAKTTEKRADAV